MVSNLTSIIITVPHLIPPHLTSLLMNDLLLTLSSLGGTAPGVVAEEGRGGSGRDRHQELDQEILRALRHLTGS